MLLTPTMMLRRLERGAIDSASVIETVELIVARYGREVGERVRDLLVALPTNRVSVPTEIATLIHASPMQDKRA